MWHIFGRDSFANGDAALRAAAETEERWARERLAAREDRLDKRAYAQRHGLDIRERRSRLPGGDPELVLYRPGAPDWDPLPWPPGEQRR